MSGRLLCVGLVLVLLASLGTQGRAAALRAKKPSLPENLARRAKVAASSEYSNHYLARFVVDGKLPAAGSHADLDKAWCVKGKIARGKGSLTFEWDQPIKATELIYYGRTAWFMSECFKGYKVYLDDDSQPAARGTFRMVHGPQRVKLLGTKTRKITLEFLSSYGGPNPGALEIQVFAASPTRHELAKLGAPVYMPWVDEVDCDQLRLLIAQLMSDHRSKYARGPQHLQRLAALERAWTQAEGTQSESAVRDELAQLQREVLLFDVERLLVIKRHEITASHVYTYHYEGFQAGGGLYVVSPHEPESKPVELVAAATGQILDCDLSHDGKVAVFSWRRKQDEGYHLWTINVDGNNLEQLTDGQWHDYNACWLPDGDVAFLTTRAPKFAYCWHAPVGILHRMQADGSGLKKLSANYLNDFTPQVLDDGRIIYSRWEYVDRPAIPIQSLWTINPDGTGLVGFFGNRVLSPGTFMEARSIPGTQKIICTMTGHNGPARGAIGVIDRSLGVNSQAAIRNITPDVPVPAVDQGNGNTSGTKQYSGPLPLDSQRFLVSTRGPVLVRTLSGSCQSTAVPTPGDGMQYFCAQPIRPRFRPPVIPSTIFDDSVSYATVFLQDVYNGLEPHVERGEVTTIRVVRDMQKTVRIDPKLRAFGFQFPVISCGATYAGKDVLGDVPVEADGSAYFRVPAGLNVSFMALDAQGRAVQRMRSFTHLMPGETQGCVGCHEHRSQTSRPHAAAAFNRVPRNLEPPPWGAGGFDYTRIVQSVLDKHCIECHDAVDPPRGTTSQRGIDLTGGKTDFFNVSYDVLARENQGRRGSPYVNWIPTYNGQEWNILEIEPKTWGSPRSRLAEIILAGHPDEKGQRRIDLNRNSIRRLLAWIDLNVPYYGTSETAHPDRIGCRRIYPDRLDEVLADVAKRRCAVCHKKGEIPRRVWTRITEPELNSFLLAPLAREAGGSGMCGKPVFQSNKDADYKALLDTFQPTTVLLKETPRMDMPGGKPACDVCRDSQ